MDCAKETGQKEIIAYLDRIEELEDGSAKAVFYVEDDEDDFRQFVLPADFLPEDADEGEYLTLTISREQEKTQAALVEAREAISNQE
jgi:hypothetical protein